MDEELSASVKTGDPIPNEDRVLRIVLASERDRKDCQIPALRCFSLSPADNGKLSVDWEKMTSPEKTIARVGASYKLKKEEYKSYKDREIYALDISFLCSFTNVDKVVYDPIYYSNPIKGRVNNPAHSLVKFNEALTPYNDPEFIMKIRDHAASRKIPVDMEKVHVLVEKLRRSSSL